MLVQKPLLRSAYLAAAIVPAFVLAIAGVAKLDDPYFSAKFVMSVFYVRIDTALQLVFATGIVELMIALAICVLIGRSNYPACIAIVMFTFFAGLLVALLETKPNAATCGCFGSLFGQLAERSLWWQVLLDMVLAALLVFHVCLGSLQRAGRRPDEQPKTDVIPVTDP